MYQYFCFRTMFSKKDRLLHMQVTIENTSTLWRRMTINIPHEQVQLSEIDKIKKLASTIKVDGFRNGKTPFNVVKQKFGKQIHQEIIAKFLKSSIPDALTKEKIIPVARPYIEKIHDKQGENLQFILTFEVFPEIKLIDFTKIVLNEQVAEITEKDIDKGLEHLKSQFATWKTVERESKKTDKLLIDFVGTIDGKPFHNSVKNDIEFEIGSNRFIPAFEEGLIGVKTGIQRNLSVTFPKNYITKALTDKLAKFTVTIKRISEKILATPDEEFAKKIGLEDGDITKIRNKIQDNMKDYLECAIRADLRAQALKILVEKHIVDIPDTLLEREKQGVQREARHQNQSTQLNEKELTEKALKRLKLSLLLSCIIKQHDVKPDKKRIQLKISKMLAMFSKNKALQKLYNKSNELFEGIRNTVLTDQATDLVIEKATKQIKPSVFYNVINKRD